MAFDFPSAPTLGQKYPASPAAGIPTYTWDGEKWTTVGGAMGGLNFVKRDGDTMTGLLQLSGDPTAVLHAVTKQYVDARPTTDPSKVAKAGDTMTGPLTINSSLTTTGDGNIGGNFGVAGTAVFMNGHQLINSAGPYNHYYDRDGSAALILGSTADPSNFLRNTQTYIQSRDGSASYGTFNSGGLSTLGLWASGDMHAYRDVSVGYLFFGSNNSHYVGFDGQRYVMPSAPLGIGTPATGTDAATVNWVYSALGGYQPALGFNPVHPGGGAGQYTNTVYIGWNNLGALRCQVDNYDIGNFYTDIANPAVSDGRLVFAADTNTAASTPNEPYGGAVVTGGSSYVAGYIMYRYRFLQLLRGSWYTIGYA